MEQNKKLDREYLQSMGKDIEFFPGVLEWFDRINKYGRELGLEIEHYVLSSGLIEIIEGSPVGDKFKCILTVNSNFKRKGIKLEDVVLENIEFNEKFKIRTDNQIEARYILTQNMMEKLLILKNKIKSFLNSE